MCKISVIIPIYNAAKTMDRCLEPLVCQTYDSYEILLVDDGSTDASAEKIRSYASRYPDKVVTVFQKKNGGASAARNRGIDLARGEYILFVDSDDYVDKTCLSSLMAHMATYAVDVLRFAFQYEYSSGRTQVQAVDFVPGEVILKEDFPQKIYTKMLCGIQMNTISRTLYRRELFDGVRFDTTMKTGEDLLCGMEIYTRARSFCYVDDVIYHYCPDGSGLTGSSLAVLEKYRCNMKLSRALLGYLKKWNMDCVKNRCLAIFRLVRITIQKLKSNNDF